MIVVNPTTRQFNIPGSDLVFGVESDSGSVVKEFQCPRYVGNNLDLTGCFIRMNYRNANGEIDSYLVTNVTVEGANIVFGWELTPKVTMYKGNITFVMCVVGPDTKVKWHTTLGRGQVLEGLEPDSDMIENGTADIVAQLIAMVEAQTEAVAAEGDKQIKAVQSAAKTAQDDAVAQVKAKGVNVRESIPDDYTALAETVDSLVRGRAGAIVCEVAGSVVAVNDASDNYVQGLRIFGRSTQDGTPTPETPVEIKSVESPKVTVAGKNLLPYPYTQTTKVESGITFVDNGDGSITASGTATTSMGFWFIGRQDHVILPAGDYTLCPYNVPPETHIDVAVSEDELSWVGVSTATNAPTTFTLRKNFYVSVRWYVSDKAVLNNATMRAMLCKAGVDLEYERPRAHRKLSIAHLICGIPVTTGGNYTDENGQQWICDEVDFERGVYVQNCFAETVTPQFDADNDRYAANLTHRANSIFTDGYGIRLLCNKLPFNRDAQKGINGIRISTYTTNYIIAYYNGENPGIITVLYPLATPIETPLSETELAAYRALHTNKPYTTILNDSGAYMSVRYAADTKLYIDNKLAALVGNN